MNWKELKVGPESIVLAYAYTAGTQELRGLQGMQGPQWLQGLQGLAGDTGENKEFDRGCYRLIN